MITMAVTASKAAWCRAHVFVGAYYFVEEGAHHALERWYSVSIEEDCFGVEDDVALTAFAAGAGVCGEAWGLPAWGD